MSEQKNGKIGILISGRVNAVTSSVAKNSGVEYFTLHITPTGSPHPLQIALNGKPDPQRFVPDELTKIALISEQGYQGSIRLREAA
jgi:hypothetical protein